MLRRQHSSQDHAPQKVVHLRCTPQSKTTTSTRTTQDDCYGYSWHREVVQCIRLLLGDTLKVSAPTGVASFIIEGTTLHSLHSLLHKRRIQAPPAPTSDVYTTRYIIIDEMSMVGRKVFGQIDCRLFPPSCSRSFWWMLTDALRRFWSTATSYGFSTPVQSFLIRAEQRTPSLTELSYFHK